MDAAVATSLLWITVAAVLAPLIAGALPRRLVPEVVLLLVAGVLIGPYVLEIASVDSEIEMLRELGLGLLFLLAGYEIDPKELTGAADAAPSSPGSCASVSQSERWLCWPHWA